jgi:hypothetical protein
MSSSENFIMFLADLRRGGVLADLGEKLEELAEAIRETERGGKMVFTLSIKPDGHGRVFVKESIKIEKPELATAETILFATADNKFQRNDPVQPDLPFRDTAPAERGELKDVEEGKPELRSIAGGAGR